METIIETQALTKHYRSKEAVHGLDLRLEAGRACAFLGRNGAGKTTTIRMLAGLVAPSSGRSFLLGRDSRALRPRDWQRIGYVSENHELYEWMTCGQLIRYTSTLYSSWDHGFEQGLVRQLQLPLDRRISRCSRGEKMKLALLLAIAFRPRLLILDEPFAGLDPLARSEFFDSLLEITRQSDWAIFFSAHDIDDVEKLADDVVVLDRGRLQIAEPLDALQERFRLVEIFGPHTAPAEGGPIMDLQRKDNHTRFVHGAFGPQVETALHSEQRGAQVTLSTLSLKQIFITLAKKFQQEERES